MNLDKIAFNIIDVYCKSNRQCFINHHIDSCNLFYNTQIKQIITEKNPITIQKDYNDKLKEYNLTCKLYIAGKKGDKLYYGKPIIYDTNNSHFMFPNEARLRNMTYAITIHYDVDVEFNIINDEGVPVNETITIDKVLLGRFPIMLQSNLCILKNLNSQMRYSLGECRNDNGGYFIIDGKEKVLIPQEHFSHNMMYIRDKVNDKYTHSCEIKSVSENSSKPIRTLSIRILAPTPTYSNNNIVVVIPNVRKPVPLFILMRALGIISDKDIIKHILLDLDKNSNYLDALVPSIYDASGFFSQVLALKYIASLTKGKETHHAYEILADYLLPHIGEMNLKDKAFYIGHMTFELLKVKLKENLPTDRDNFKFKRIETSGELMYQLFKEYYNIQYKSIFQKIDKEYYYHEGIYSRNFKSLIISNSAMFFSEKTVESGFKKGFKGNWGSTSHTKKLGAVQDLNRLSFNSALSHLRKINLDIDDSAKVVGPRLLHGSQWGKIDPVDTPDGGNVGLHKHMSFMTKITVKYSREIMLRWLDTIVTIYNLDTLETEDILKMTKVFVNGFWRGMIENPIELEIKFLTSRRIGLIPLYTSFCYDKLENTINIYTDGGRLCRPLFYYDNEELALMNKKILKKIETNNYSWDNCISGFLKKKIDFNIDHNKCYQLEDLYDGSNYKEMENFKAFIEYIDSSEEDNLMIVSNLDDVKPNIKYTHMEIHPSMIFGIMGNQVILPENNQLPRNLFACGQAKQGVSMYHSNYHNRIDKMGVLLNYGQLPILKSRLLKYINNEQHPCGENVMVAIMCYSSYNVEDAILINRSALDRGLFQTTYLNMYETREESSKVGKNTTDSRVTKIDNTVVTRLKAGYDYNYLDDNGLIKENTHMNDKIVLIGKTITNLANPEVKEDASIFPKKGQLGYVDKTYMTEEEEGYRLVKVRIREQRTPAIGDKFCSRCGQKGTIGLVIPEENMPFTKNGMKPDIIVNPHAIPSRMTIGQLVETIMGKCCLNYGGFGDSTAFVNKGPKHLLYGNLLQKSGLHSSGNEIMYNGMTGEQIETEVFFGPTYYMRLKHMVKDKINYRARGPKTLLTRQTVHGRANDGGLRVGEMERDVIIAHGMSKFLQDSMMNRGDEYKLAICNTTGVIAIYNENKNMFISPLADGPVKFSTNDLNELNIKHITKYGRSFSVINIPYSFKLLMQELGSINVHMRIITEDNIDQIENMNFKNFSSIKISKNKKIKEVQEDNDDEKNEAKGIINEMDDELEEIYSSNSKLFNKDNDEDEDEDEDEEKLLENGLFPWKKEKIDGEEDNFVSVILDDNGTISDVWLEQLPEKPNIYPADWIHQDVKELKKLKYPLKTYSEVEKIITEELINNPIANNWDYVINKLKTQTEETEEIKEVEENKEIMELNKLPQQVHPLGLPNTMNPQINSQIPLQMDPQMLQTGYTGNNPNLQPVTTFVPVTTLINTNGQSQAPSIQQGDDFEKINLNNMNIDVNDEIDENDENDENDEEIDETNKNGGSSVKFLIKKNISNDNSLFDIKKEIKKEENN